MFKERLERLISQVLEAFNRDIRVGNLHEEQKNLDITVYLVSNATTTHGFADSLAPIVFNELDRESDEEIMRRLNKHITDYLAISAKA